MDPFEDLFAEAAAKPAPARSKFLPKVKPGPKKGPSVLKPCVTSVHGSSNVPEGPSSGLSNIEKPKALAPREGVTHFEKPGFELENVEPVTSERDGDVAISESNVSKSHTSGSSAAGIDPLGIDDDNLSDLLPVPNQPVERGGKIQPKRKARQSSDDRALDSSASFPVATDERPSGDGDWPSSFTKSAEENTDVLSHLESLDGLLTASMNKEEHTPGNFHEGNELFSSHSKNVELDTNAEKISGLSVQNSPDSSHFMGPECFPDLEAAERLPEITRSSGGKFIPKPKARDGTKKPDSRTCDVLFTDNEQDPLVHLESERMDYVTVPGTLNDHVAPSSFDASNSEDLEHLELNPDKLEKLSQRPEKASMDNAVDGEGRKSSRRLRNRVAARHLVDESDGDAQDDESFDPEPNSSMDGEDGVGENGDQSAFEKKKATRKSRPSKSKDGKPSRKRKGAEEASEKCKEAPKKKFSHSTRRSRRVDKALLETPEEEIDYQRLKIRDLILLAEHNERSAKKSVKPSTKPSNGQSVGNASDADDARNKEGSLPYEDGNSSAQPSERVEPGVTLFNYQSFMERTPSTRWSKQATELFYEGIRQFGTDLSMIKELFPSLTHHQVKLKFKKEERQNRLRLFDALSSRAKDHKHFEFVLERLQAADQAEKESELDNSEAVTLEDAEDSGPETNGPDEAAKPEKGVDEAAISERDEGTENGDTAGNVGKVESPLKSDENGEPEVEDDDDDFDFFSSYKSEL